MKMQSILAHIFIFAFLLRLKATAVPQNLCEAVLDTDGNQLQPNTPYYIVSAVRGGRGGGLTVTPRDRSSLSTSSAAVKQHSYNMNFGSPVTFSPVPLPLRLKSIAEVPSTLMEPQERSIHVSTDLNIQFAEMPGVWHVEGSGQERYVTLEGKPGNPGKSTVRNWFKILPVNGSGPSLAYRIKYCPGLCDSCHVSCGDVGIRNERGTRWLSVSTHGHMPFIFVKAGAN